MKKERLLHNKLTPCRECPFLSDSVAGWLGPDSVKSVKERVMGESEYPCHMDVSRSMKEDGCVIHNGVPAGITEKIQQCAGAIICANKSHKSYRDEVLRNHQQWVIDNKNVMTIWQFEKRHEVKRDR